MVSQLSSGKKGDRASNLEIAIELNNFVTLLYKNNEKRGRTTAIAVETATLKRKPIFDLSRTQISVFVF
jgi:hypothetical protein